MCTNPENVFLGHMDVRAHTKNKITMYADYRFDNDTHNGKLLLKSVLLTITCSIETNNAQNFAVIITVDLILIFLKIKVDYNNSLAL